ncbi:CAAX amino terminal protease family protein [Minicystis rosea]|nr:CAAX amino terminal protease family protein [Minicystis rosea]
MSTPSDVEPPMNPYAPPSGAPDPEPRAALEIRTSARGPLIAATITTVLVTAASYLAPERYAATLVGVIFLAATWWLVLRHDETTVRASGLSLGGLLEPTALDPKRIVREAAVAAAWALLLVAIVFPPFWFGYRWWWHTRHVFMMRWPPSLFDEIAGQLVVIALPEEAFFRGYLQTSLDRAWPPRWRILGADLGPGWLLAAAIFAVGHVLTIRHPARLAVFFPALIFGWMRSRTGGIGASVLFHASCNVFSATLGRGYGLM